MVEAEKNPYRIPTSCRTQFVASSIYRKYAAKLCECDAATLSLQVRSGSV